MKLFNKFITTVIANIRSVSEICCHIFGSFSSYQHVRVVLIIDCVTCRFGFFPSPCFEDPPKKILQVFEIYFDFNSEGVQRPVFPYFHQTITLSKNKSHSK